jgi:hypothetical protein
MPWYSRVPEVGSTRPRAMRAIVVLPLPLSPASVKISGPPSPTVRLALLTATRRERAKLPPSV